MADLSKLYLAREVFTEYNAEIPIELQNQIKKAERDLIQHKMRPASMAKAGRWLVDLCKYAKLQEDCLYQESGRLPWI